MLICILFKSVGMYSDRRDFLKKTSTVGISVAAFGTIPVAEAAGQVDRTIKTRSPYYKSRVYQSTTIKHTDTDVDSNETEYEFRLMTTGAGVWDTGGVTHNAGDPANIIAQQYTDIYNPSGNLGFLRGIGRDHFGMWPASGTAQTWKPGFKSAITALASSVITEVKSKAKWFLTAGKVVEALVPDEAFFGSSEKGNSGVGFRISKNHSGGFFGSSAAKQCCHLQEFNVVVPDNSSKEIVKVVSGVPCINNATDNDAGIKFELVFGDGNPYLQNVTHIGTDW